MKKQFFAVFIGILLGAVGLFAAIPTSVITDGSYTSLGKLTISSAAAYDTIVATDSNTIVNKQKFTNGAEYVLAVGAITGGGSDSVALQVNVTAYDDNSIFLIRKAVDTITVATGKQVLLPINSTIVGDKFSVTLTGLATNGGEVIIGRIYIYYRKATVQMR